MECPIIVIYHALRDDMVGTGVISSGGKLSKRSFTILSQHPALSDRVLQATPFIGGDMKSSLKERVYAIANVITQPRTCAVCGIVVPFRNHGVSVGYPNTCSQRCNARNPERQAKRTNTSLKRYGTKAPQQSDQAKTKTRATNLQKYGTVHANQKHMLSGGAYGLLTTDGWLHHQHYVLQQHISTIANKLGVVGGFSKLLHHFTSHHKWDDIITFADMRCRAHKFNYRRRNLPLLLNNFDPVMSERQNCDANGVLRTWDCGKIRYILKQ